MSVPSLSLRGSHLEGRARMKERACGKNSINSPNLHCCLLVSCSVISDSLWPHGLQHTRLPCPSLFLGVCSNSLSSSWSCYPTISVAFFSSCPQPFRASGSFPVNRLFASGGPSIGVSLQHQSFQWIFRLISFRIDWFDLLAGQGTLKSLLQHHSSKASILRRSAFFPV